MSIARVIELSSSSEQGFEDAIDQGIQRATSTLRNVERFALGKGPDRASSNRDLSLYSIPPPPVGRI